MALSVEHRHLPSTRCLSNKWFPCHIRARGLCTSQPGDQRLCPTRLSSDALLHLVGSGRYVSLSPILLPSWPNLLSSGMSGEYIPRLESHIKCKYKCLHTPHRHRLLLHNHCLHRTFLSSLHHINHLNSKYSSSQLITSNLVSSPCLLHNNSSRYTRGLCLHTQPTSPHTSNLPVRPSKVSSSILVHLEVDICTHALLHPLERPRKLGEGRRKSCAQLTTNARLKGNVITRLQILGKFARGSMSAVIVVRKRSRVGDIRPGIARTSLQMDDS